VSGAPIDRVVIVGANLAGGRAAEALRSAGFDGDVVLAGDEPDRPYERPPLSKQILRGEWPREKAFLREESWYVENRIELRLGTRVASIDPGGSVEASGGERIAFDRLLLCTGGRPRRLDLPGADLEGVHTLRTFADAEAIGAFAREGARAVVVGAGFIGSEVAASLRSNGAEVTLLEVAPVPLGHVLGERLGERLGRLHRDRGVDLRTGVRIEAFEGDGRVRAVRLEGGERIEAGVVVLGVGITPNDDLARAAGIGCDNGVLVDERCATSAPGVFAAGDVANHPNAVFDRRIRIEHWQNAQSQAAAAAKAMLGATEPYTDVPWFWSDQYDAVIQMFGLPEGFDELVVRGDLEDEQFAAYFLGGGRLLASFALNAAKDARAVRPLIGARVDGAALADPSTDLRALAKAAP